MNETEPVSAGTPPLVRVDVHATDRGAEITLIDASFQRVALGIGSLSVSVPVGLYKARFRAGDRTEEKLFEVAGHPVVVESQFIEFSSPIPLDNTSTHHEYHSDPARALADGPVREAFGEGSELFIFARDSGHVFGKPVSIRAPWSRLSLHSADGVLVAEIGKVGSVDEISGYAGLKLRVSPGLYFLENDDFPFDGLTTALPVVACTRWCTHVYIDSRNAFRKEDGDWKPHRTLDLAGAAVVMVKIQGHSALDEAMARSSELARQGLVLGQRGISEEDINYLAHGKFEFPMLGLYAAHFLLDGPNRDTERARLILRNLQTLLGGEHPDVNVLLAVCGDAPTPTPFASRLWPPMLAETWMLAKSGGAVIHASLNSYLRQYRVGGSLWSCLQFPSDGDRPYATVGDVPFPVAMRFSLRAEPFLDRWRTTSEVRGSSESEAEQFAEWKRLAPGLHRPNPRQTPFQQALRRMLLDAVDSDDINLRASIASLAQQYRLTSWLVADSLLALREEAEAQLNPKTLSG